MLNMAFSRSLFNFNYVIFFAFQIFFINLQQTIYDKIKPIMASINESKQ